MKVHRLTKKSFPVICACLLLCLGLGVEGKSDRGKAKPDLSGTWVFDEALTRRAKPKQFPMGGQVMLVITHRTPEVSIKSRMTTGAGERERDFTYYDDGRGETNPGPTMSLELNDVTPKIKSVTVWKGGKLMTTGTVRQARGGSFYKVDELDLWELSPDGQTLTQTISVRADSVRSDQIKDVGVPAVIIPFGGEIKRVYRRSPN